MKQLLFKIVKAIIIELIPVIAEKVVEQLKPEPHEQQAEN